MANSSMSLQDRYDEVSRISGLSEDVIRRVYKATGESLARSLKKGEMATLPGICTITPEVKNRICIDETGSNLVSYIKLKAKASTALESKLAKLKEFDKQSESSTETSENEALDQLHIMNRENMSFSSFRRGSSDGVVTNQISALL